MSTHYRFTIKQLKDMDDVLFIATLLNERKNSCTNPYAPLTQRLDATLSRLEHGTLTGYTQAKKDRS
jgi:hypothetical protein